MNFNEFLTAFKNNTMDILKNHFWDFEGRVDLWGFWLWVFFLFLCNFLLGLVVPGLAGVFQLAMLAPSLGIMARRLHDINKSGWLQLLHFVPVIGSVALLIICVIPGKDEPNDYGNPPPRRRFHS